MECLKKATSVEQVARLIQQGFDLFFNLRDGAADQNIPGIEVVRSLKTHDVGFTGATSEFYEHSREAMKLACRSEGIDTPDYVLARYEAQGQASNARNCRRKDRFAEKIKIANRAGSGGERGIRTPVRLP